MPPPTLSILIPPTSCYCIYVCCQPIITQFLNRPNKQADFKKRGQIHHVCKLATMASSSIQNICSTHTPTRPARLTKIRKKYCNLVKLETLFALKARINVFF